MWDIRPITAADADLFRARLARGFGRDLEDDEATRERFEAIFEYPRTFAVFEGEDIIGTGAGFSLAVTVPGGALVPMAGTTVITVQPTHRRRGVLRAFMDLHLDDVEANGEPLAGLWASESSIYGRFGYGPATFRNIVEVDVSAVEMTRETAAPALVRFVEVEEAKTLVPDLYEQALPTRAGMLSRKAEWWTHRIFADPESWRDGMSMLRFIVADEGGVPTGYATFRQKAKWEGFVSEGQVGVEELIALTPAAHTALWAFLTNIDLFPKLEYWNTPVDDPLPFKVRDHRRVGRRLNDALYLRVMDVVAALEARTYEIDGRLLIGVDDSTRPEVSGTYLLEVEDGSGSCTRVDVPAEVRLAADVLGHLYLGGGDALSMAAAGRIDGDPELVRRLHRLFRTDAPPWCPEVF